MPSSAPIALKYADVLIGENGLRLLEGNAVLDEMETNLAVIPGNFNICLQHQTGLKPVSCPHHLKP